MRPSLIWLMEHLAGEDWQTMNIILGNGFYINIPLSLFFTILLTIIVNGLIYVIRCLFVPSIWRQGYDAGYGDGVYTKACKLAKIKFNHDDNVIVCEVNPKEIDKEVEEAVKKY